MAADSGDSDLRVHPTEMVRRPDPVSNRQPRRDSSEQRKKKPLANPRRRSLYDLLFDEIDRIDSLSEPQRVRIKANIRSHVTDNAPAPQAKAPPPDHAGGGKERTVAPLLSTPPPSPPIDEEHIVRAAAPQHAALSSDEAKENRILAEQLRVCLAQHTEQARKIGAYLHLLLGTNNSQHLMTLDI